jgi:transposase
LGLNSQNSHKPPSSDGYRKKRIQPALPKDKKPRGGQPGHTGRTLQAVEKPDQVQVHLPERCAVCGRVISVHESHEVVGKRQVFDVPGPRLAVTEHRLGEITCCGQAQRGIYPADVTASVQYGPGVRALVTQLSVDHKMPLEQICRLFEDLFGHALNSETVEAALEQGYELAAGVEAATVEQLKRAKVVHFDETGLRVAGRLRWLHTASNSLYTHLFVHPRRGGEALRSAASVLKDFGGRAIHDCLPAYYQFEQAKHGACLAHILRELQGLVEHGSAWAEAMHAFLLHLYEQARPLRGEAAAAARNRYWQIVSEAELAEPPPEQQAGRGRPRSTAGRNLLRRLKEHEEAVLAFALVEGVPFTNNQAERDLRPAKVKQKVSGCFRTDQGAAVYARLQAVISTCRKQGRNVFAMLRDLFARQPVCLLAGG